MFQKCSTDVFGIKLYESKNLGRMLCTIEYR